MDSRGAASSADRYLAGPYLPGLCVAALGVCAGGWVALVPFAFGYPSRGRAAVTDLATGSAVGLVSLLTLVCWSVAWRRRMRADGVLPARPSRQSVRSTRRQARAERLVRSSRQRELTAAPDPAQVLTDLRALLTPLLSADDHQVQAPGHLRAIRPAGGPAAEPPLRDAELLVVGTGEEEAW
jgi:hypothetical protein